MEVNMNYQEKLFLKANVAITPTIGNWYAWSYLLSPMTAANYFFRYLEILDSFISEPNYHYAAATDLKTASGPFVRYQADKVQDIVKLKSELENSLGGILKFRESLRTLNQLIFEHPKGYSFEQLYQKLPVDIRGKVELVYDLWDNPSFRLFEELIYNALYDIQLQSIFLSKINDFNRPFCMSTPFTNDHSNIQVAFSFANPLVDEICKLKKTSAPLNEIKELFRIDDYALLNEYLTLDSPENKYYKPLPGETRVRYFGHASLLFEHDNMAIMTDPVIAYPNDKIKNIFSYSDLPDDLDYILITHNHSDHFDFETLIQLRSKIGGIIVPRNNQGFIADPSMKTALLRSGFKNIIELNPFEEFKINNMSIIALPFLGEHGDLNIHSKATYLLKINSRKFLIAVDSNNIDTEIYHHIKTIYGNIDTLYIGMESEGAPFSWAYGPLLNIKPKVVNEMSRRLCGSNQEKALALVKMIEAKEVYVYAMGLEPWLSHIIGITFDEKSTQMQEANKLMDTCNQANINCKILQIKDEFIYEI
jgi:L-ascorbate metabolism protein UlaG (beta-lactamase superfamily)